MMVSTFSTRSDISTQHLHGRQPAEKNLRILNRHFVSVSPALQSSTESRLEKLKPFRVFGLMLAVPEYRFTTEEFGGGMSFFPDIRSSFNAVFALPRASRFRRTMFCLRGVLRLTRYVRSTKIVYQEKIRRLEWIIVTLSPTCPMTTQRLNPTTRPNCSSCTMTSTMPPMLRVQTRPSRSSPRHGRRVISRPSTSYKKTLLFISQDTCCTRFSGAILARTAGASRKESWPRLPKNGSVP